MRPRFAMVTQVALAAPVALLGATPLSAQQVVTPASSTHGAITATKDGLTLPAGDFTVAELIEATAVYLCRNYLYDPGMVAHAAGFTLQRPVAVDALGSEELLHALLATRDLVVVPIDELRGLHQVVSIGPNAPPLPASSFPWRSPEEILHRPRLREIVVTTFELREAFAQQLAQALRSHFAVAGAGAWRPGQLTAFAVEQHTLLLCGYRDQVAHVLMLGRQLERLAVPPTPTPPAPPSLHERIEQLEREVAELKRNAQTR